MTMTKTNLHQYFKEAVAEARAPFNERGAILHCCNIPSDWFKKHGRYVHLTDARIDAMSEGEIRLACAVFIADCYRSR